jgi:hypothetical protein
MIIESPTQGTALLSTSQRSQRMCSATKTTMRNAYSSDPLHLAMPNAMLW